MENPIRMDDLGVPPFMETPIFRICHALHNLIRLPMRFLTKSHMLGAALKGQFTSAELPHEHLFFLLGSMIQLIV